MKIQYRFTVQGFFRMDGEFQLQLDEAVVTAELSPLGTLRALLFTYTLPRDSALPTFEVTEGAIPHLSIPSTPFAEHARAAAQNVEDQLCMLGIDGIDTADFGVKWLPEEGDEAQDLRVDNVQMRPGVPEQAFAKWRAPLIAKALQTAHADQLFRLQLTFYREGQRHFHRWEHATAFMFFYFFVEALFGDSEIKKAPLINAFQESTELTSAVLQAAQVQQSHSIYRSLSPHDALKRVVERRCYLFHNPTKRAREWSESVHKEMGDDAAFLASTAGHIVNLRLWPSGTFPGGSIVRDEAYYKLDGFMKSGR